MALMLPSAAFSLALSFLLCFFYFIFPSASTRFFSLEHLSFSRLTVPAESFHLTRKRDYRRTVIPAPLFCYFFLGLKLSFRDTERLNTSLPGLLSLLSRQK